MDNRQTISLISLLVELWGRWRPVEDILFGENELVKPLRQLKIPWYGAYLNMPAAVSAVISSPEGKQVVFASGGLLNLPEGIYGLKYVDMKQRSTYISNIQIKSKDAWQVSVDLEAIWRVNDPILITNTQNPLLNLVDICRSTSVDVIQSYPHDGVVASPEVEPIQESKLSNKILERLNNRLDLRGFHFISVTFVQK